MGFSTSLCAGLRDIKETWHHIFEVARGMWYAVSSRVLCGVGGRWEGTRREKASSGPRSSSLSHARVAMCAILLPPHISLLKRPVTLLSETVFSRISYYEHY